MKRCVVFQTRNSYDIITARKQLLPYCVELLENDSDLAPDQIFKKFKDKNLIAVFKKNLNDSITITTRSLSEQYQSDAISHYIINNLYYKTKSDLVYCPQNFMRSVEFKTSGIVEFLNNLTALNPMMHCYGVVTMINYVFRNGVYFTSPINRRIRSNWQPGIAGIPFTKKPRDPMHECTYMIHDFYHYAIKPDVIFNGIDTPLNRKLYMISRMMSEAMTIVLADMIFVHSVLQSGNDYRTVNDRLIYPLFKHLTLNFDPCSEEFIESLYRLLFANVHFCLTGETDLLQSINSSINSSIEINNYVEKYSRFFIQDFIWTDNNYNQMTRDASVYRSWYDIVDSINQKYQLNLVSIDDLKKSINATDNMQNSQLIQLIFDHVFNNNIKPLFKSRSIPDLIVSNNLSSNLIVNNNLSPNPIVSNNLSKAFARYICNQIMIFDKYNIPESQHYKDYILNQINSDITQEKINDVRYHYKKFLDICYDKSLISLDDVVTFDELYCPIDSISVDYDNPCGSLSAVSKRLLS